MSSLKNIMVVDDNGVNRTIMSKILSRDYHTILAENGQEALEILDSSGCTIDAIMLDLIMPVMDGYEFLRAIRKQEKYKELPVIVITGNRSKKYEAKALEFGAWDFVSKPYDPQIIQFRLKTVLERRQLLDFQKMEYASDFDPLTGLYNRFALCRQTQKMLVEHTEEQFAFIQLNLEGFSLINSFYGSAEGDEILCSIADWLRILAEQQTWITYGRIEANIFAFCIQYQGVDQIDRLAKQLEERLKGYPLAFDLTPIFGIYKVIPSQTVCVNQMMGFANLAAKHVKGSDSVKYAFYHAEMGKVMEKERALINKVKKALEEEQFGIYFQPQYSLHTNLPVGAKALIGWKNPSESTIIPEECIPIFDRSGLIAKSDFYVWKKVCIFLQAWLEKGLVPPPIAVNISRANVYHPNFIDSLCMLADQYHVPRQLLNLEITESTYENDAHRMREIIKRLHAEGFLIVTDDLNNGSLSLNMMKNTEIDALKIDMKFLSESDILCRGEKIIASIVQMAKDLGIYTITQGIEKAEQIEFLRSIGCDYAQGDFFGKPLTIDEYEKLISQRIF